MTRGWTVVFMIGAVQGLAAVVAVPTYASAQTLVQGTVRDSASGDVVADARVELRARRLLTVTDAGGRFRWEGVPAGRHVVTVSRIGYRVREIAVVVTDTNPVDVTISIAPVALRLSDIVVSPGHFGVMDAPVVAEQTMTREDIESVPQVGEDVFRAVKRLPGVASDDISTRLNVRGSTDQELLVRLDGMELYEPYHLKDFDGVLGIVDVQSVGGVDLITGGFPVEYGDKTAGVFDMRSRSAPVDGVRTTLGLSITNASFMSQGAFAGGDGQWLASVRRGYLDIALALVGNDDDLHPVYYDAFGKVAYQLHPNHRLEVDVLHAGDGLEILDEPDSLDSGWSSSYAWARVVSAFGGIEAETMVFGGRVTRSRRGRVDDPLRTRGPEFVFVDDDRRFRFAGVREQVTIPVGQHFMLKVGGEAKRVDATYDYFSATRTVILTPAQELGSLSDTVDVALEPDGYEWSGYLGARVRPVSPLTVEVGARYDRWSHTDEDDLTPRAMAALDLGPATTVRASWGRYAQSHGVHELEVGDGEEAFAGAERAETVALGIGHRWGTGTELRVEAYRRTIPDRRPRFLNADREIDAFPEAEGDRLRIDPDRGRAHGVEVLLARDEGRAWGWSLNYAAAVAEDEIGGRWVPATLDQRHTVGASVAWRPGPRWRLSGSFQYHTGWPATESTFRIDSLADGSLRLSRDLGPLNALRLPAYHRIDFRVAHTFSLGRGVLQAYLDLFNVYDRLNLRSYGYNVTVRNGEVFTRQVGGEGLLPFLPSLGFRYEF